MPAHPSTSTPRREFTRKDDVFLAQYLAKYNADGVARNGNAIWRRLCENRDRLWPWSRNHSEQSWRNRYVKNKAKFDHQIAILIAKNNARSGENEAGPSQHSAAPAPPSPSTQPPTQSRPRQPFTNQEKHLLAQFLASENPGREGRSGPALYKKLESETKKWPWGKSHPWSSWAEQYKQNKNDYEQRIAQILNEQHKDTWIGKGKRRQGSVPADAQPPQAKKRRVISEPSSSGSETEEEDQLADEQYERARPDLVALREEEEEESQPAEDPRPQPSCSGSKSAESKAMAAQKVVEAEEEEEEEDNPKPPASDDYGGAIFDKSEEEDEEEDAAEEDSGDAKEAAELLRRKSSEESTDEPQQATASRHRSPDYDLGYIDPSVPGPSAPHTSQARPPSQRSKDSQPSQPAVSQVVPSPETLRQISLAQMSSQQISQGPTPPASDAHPFSPNRPAHPPPPEPETSQAIPTRKRKRRPVEVELFVSSPSREPESPKRPAKRPREPPVLVDGMHNHAFTDRKGRPGYDKGARRKSGVGEDDDDEEEEVKQVKPTQSQGQWPPARGRHKATTSDLQAQAPVKKLARQPVAANQLLAARTPSPAKPAAPGAARQHHPFSQPSQEPYAPPHPVLGTPRLHHPFSQPTQDFDTPPPAQRPTILAMGRMPPPPPPQGALPKTISPTDSARLVQALATISAFTARPAEQKPKEEKHSQALPPEPIAGPSKRPAVHGRPKPAGRLLAAPPSTVTTVSSSLAAKPQEPAVHTTVQQAAPPAPAQPRTAPEAPLVLASVPLKQPVEQTMQTATEDLRRSPTPVLAVVSSSDKGKQREMLPPPVPPPNRRHTIGPSLPSQLSPSPSTSHNV
ncbi:hypothetical protein EIP91_010620, partial [Steccherinum ochraceum]